MKKIITLILVLALAGTMGTTAAFAAPDDTTPTTGETRTDKVLLKVNCFGDGQIVGTDDGSEPVFDDEYPMQSIAFNMDKGATAKVKAKANEGYKFMYWFDEDTETIYSMEDTIEITMDEPLSLIAYFDVDAERVLLKANVLGEGLISGTQDGTEPGFGEDDIYGDSVALNVIKGETAKLKAQPKEGYIFVCWANEDTNEIISMEDTIEVTMDEPLNLIAAFDVAGVRHRVNVNIGEGVGQLAWSEDGSEPEFDEYHDTSLALSIVEGRTVTIKAKPDEGYKFMFWYDEDKQEIISSEDTISFEATKGMNITANFDLDVDRVLLKVNTEGMGQIVGDENDDDPQFDDDTSIQSLALNVIPGNTVVIKAKADDGYKFAGWKNAADGKIVSTDDTYYVTVNEAMELVAVFEPIENNNDNNGDNNDNNNGNNSNDGNNNGKTDNSGSNNTPADNKPANNTPANGTNTPVSTPTTGDATSAAALAAVTLGSLGAVVMLAKKHRKDEE